MNSENRVNFANLAQVEVRPGLVIEGFSDIRSLNDLVRTLQAVVAEEFTPEQGQQRDRLRGQNTVFSYFPAQLLEDQVHSRFTGRLESLRVTILPSDTSFIKVAPEGVVQDSAFNFLAEADMHSSGRGVVGVVSREFCMYVRYRRQGPQKEVAPYIMMTSRRKSRDLGQWEKVVDESRERYMDVWRRALLRIASAGLPTLGKRR